MDNITFILEDFIASLENLPDEIQHLMEEISGRGQECKGLKKQVDKDTLTLDKLITTTSYKTQKPDEISTVDGIDEKYKAANDILDQTASLAKRGVSLVERAIRKLEYDMIKVGGTSAADLFSETLAVKRLADSMISGSTMLPTPSPEKRKRSNRPPQNSRRRAEDEDGLPLASRRRDGTPDSEAETPYCYCGQPSFGDMVACDNESCPYEWFHYECVGLKEPPKGVWFCPDCKEEMAQKRARVQ